MDAEANIETAGSISKSLQCTLLVIATGPAQVPPEPTTATTTIPPTTSGEQVDSTTAISTTPNEQPVSNQKINKMVNLCLNMQGGLWYPNRPVCINTGLNVVN